MTKKVTENTMFNEMFNFLKHDQLSSFSYALGGGGRREVTLHAHIRTSLHSVGRLESNPSANSATRNAGISCELQSVPKLFL